MAIDLTLLGAWRSGGRGDGEAVEHCDFDDDTPEVSSAPISSWTVSFGKRHLSSTQATNVTALVAGGDRNTSCIGPERNQRREGGNGCSAQSRRRRRHKLSSLSVTAQSYVIVELRLANGAEGIGEAATLGGPRWSEESVESIKATIDIYLAPAMIGQRADCFEAAGARMDTAAKRNNAAKAAVETALFDAVGKTLGMSASALLGGAVRDRMQVLWTLASGDAGQEIEEAETKLAARLHDTFKVKIGAQAPEADLARLRRLAAALQGRAGLIVDANQAWDETIAARCLPVLADLGVHLVEQPVPAWNVPGLARLRARSAVPLMADESVFSSHDMLAVANAAAADVVSLKLVKHGGLLNTRKVAAVAEAAGIGLYGGCLLESSIGAAAHLQVFASLRELGWGCEHFGPQILTDDLVTEPLRFEEFQVHLPVGPGIGVTLDRDKLRRYARS